MLRESPVTWCMLFVCPLLWVLDLAVSMQANVNIIKASQLFGGPDPIAVWDGEWWRILTSAFHHGGFVHLALNLSFLGYYGRLLEFRLGRLNYLLFCLMALAVSSVFQNFWGPSVGLSGMAFAQFGLIWIWRRTDAWWQDQVSADMVQMGFLAFFGCYAVDLLGLIPIGNVAHSAGLLYGAFVGLTRFGSPRARMWWPVLLSSHIFLLPLFYLVTHPVWNGLYHWRLAERTEKPSEQIHHYENALRCDPDLEGAWNNLALIHLKEHEPVEAWRCVIRGLARHPSSTKMIDLAREIALVFAGRANRAKAVQQLELVFGDQAEAWEKLLFNQIPLEDLAPVAFPSGKTPARPNLDPEGRIEEPAIPDLPTTLPRRALDEIPRTPSQLPPVDPDAPGSAEEGRAA